MRGSPPAPLFVQCYSQRYRLRLRVRVRQKRPHPRPPQVPRGMRYRSATVVASFEWHSRRWAGRGQRVRDWKDERTKWCPQVMRRLPGISLSGVSDSDGCTHPSELRPSPKRQREQRAVRPFDKSLRCLAWAMLHQPSPSSRTAEFHLAAT